MLHSGTKYPCPANYTGSNATTTCRCQVWVYQAWWKWRSSCYEFKHDHYQGWHRNNHSGACALSKVSVSEAIEYRRRRRRKEEEKS